MAPSSATPKGRGRFGAAARVVRPSLVRPPHGRVLDADLLCSWQGVEKLSKGLTSVKMIRRVPHATYNHLDFLYARDSRPLLYDQVMQSIAEVLQQQ